MYLPDVNVWLALNFSQHKHHGSAKLWFDALPDDQRCYFCRLTQMGFLRLSTNPKANPLQTQTMSQAWTIYSATLLDPRIGFLAESDGLEAQWRQWSQLGTFSPNVWSDAYLAAFAHTAGLTVVTFDTGFNQYAGLSVLILT
jgi:hypothetical protein